MSNHNAVKYLNDRIGKIRRELIVLNERHRQQEESLIDEKTILESLLENMKRLNKITGLDDNGNYPCRACGSAADERMEPDWFASRRSFGCQKCDIFYCDEDMWNEKNKPN